MQQLGRRDDEGRTKAFAAPSLDDANKITEMAADSFILLMSIIALQEVEIKGAMSISEKQPSVACSFACLDCFNIAETTRVYRTPKASL